MCRPLGPEAVQSRQPPVENVDLGCGTAVACHMANISYPLFGFRSTRQRRREPPGEDRLLGYQKILSAAPEAEALGLRVTR